ncbi:MAG: GMP/IMP nucleotidase [Woeseiaceae bacterium]|nr:GMP/IMP nucleotidase [Woeseiaceae bacterium]
MAFDPKTGLAEAETLMLDMDGTVLDLAYDNYMWLRHLPARYAEKQGISVEAARRDLLARYGAVQGSLTWYCLDHWSERLGLDVFRLHQDERHRIGYLPGARDFLERMRDAAVRVLLVTNSHPDTLRLKDEVTGLFAYFDGVYSAHHFGYAKECREFWDALRAETAFDPATTMFVDDSHPVLESARDYGIRKLVAVTRPDTSVAPRDSAGFVGIEGVRDLG